MAFIDALSKISFVQAVVAAVVSTNSIDIQPLTNIGLGTPPKRQVGPGEALGFGVSVDVAASLTTFLIELISATDTALTAGLKVHGSITGAQADFAVGKLHFVPIPTGDPDLQRYVGLRYTPTGGAATVTVSAWLTTQAEFSQTPPRAYAKNYVP
jgi:hypothetical protein